MQTISGMVFTKVPVIQEKDEIELLKVLCEKVKT